MKKTFRILTLLLLLTVAAACNTSDDVTEIFNGHRFKITGITYNGIKTTKEAEELYTDNGTYTSHSPHKPFRECLQMVHQLTAHGRPKAKAARWSLDSDIRNRPTACRKYAG